MMFVISNQNIPKSNDNDNDDSKEYSTNLNVNFYQCHNNNPTNMIIQEQMSTPNNRINSKMVLPLQYHWRESDIDFHSLIHLNIDSEKTLIRSRAYTTNHLFQEKYRPELKHQIEPQHHSHNHYHHHTEHRNHQLSMSTILLLIRQLIVVILLFTMCSSFSSLFCMAQTYSTPLIRYPNKFSNNNNLSSNNDNNNNGNNKSNHLNNHHYHGHYYHHHHHHHSHKYRHRHQLGTEQNFHLPVYSTVSSFQQKNSHQYYRSSPSLSMQYHRRQKQHRSRQPIPEQSSINDTMIMKARWTEQPIYSSSRHNFQQLIREKTLSKQRKHRHTYYSDILPSTNRKMGKTTDINNDTGNTMVSVLKKSMSIRKNGARSLFSISMDSNNNILNNNKTITPKMIYQLNWIQSDDELPVCDQWQVCNKVDTYSIPWVEKQCRCPSATSCSMSLNANDEHTIQEKTVQYKLCEPVKKLPTCRYFRDITWTITTTSLIKNEQEFNSLLTRVNGGGNNGNDVTLLNNNGDQYQNENITKQEVKCICPANSVAYILKHQVHKNSDGQLGYRYYFACSPETVPFIIQFTECYKL